MMNPNSLNEWRMLLGDHPPISLPYWVGEKVFVSTAARNSIYEQLLSLKGKRVIDLVPCDEEDWNKYTELTTLPGHWEDWSPDQHCAARKIGTLTDVAKNVRGYTYPLNEIFAKFSPDEKFHSFQWKAYELHIGLDSNHTKYEYERADDGWSPKDWRNGFTITDCKVKGLYLSRPRFSDDYNFDVGLRNYYHLRTIGMYVYLPGRAYY